MPSDLYQSLYPGVVQRLKETRRFHGSYLRDLFIEDACGRYAIDNHGERLIRELVESQQIKICERAPTHSQAAFIGLQFSAKAYEKLEWVPGIIEHYFYEWI